MPLHTVHNDTDRRMSVRTATGLHTLMPGQSRDLDIATGHVDYYRRSGAKVAAIEGEPGGPAGGKRPLTSLSADELRATAEAEGADLGDVDLSTETGRATAAAIIGLFRTVWATGNLEAVRSLAGTESVDLAGATTKRDIVNRIVAARGVSI